MHDNIIIELCVSSSAIFFPQQVVSKPLAAAGCEAVQKI